MNKRMNIQAADDVGQDYHQLLNHENGHPQEYTIVGRLRIDCWVRKCHQWPTMAAHASVSMTNPSHNMHLKVLIHILVEQLP